MKNTISRKDISKIHDVLQDQFKDSINLHQYEIHGALMALSKSRELIKLNMERECSMSKEIEEIVIDKIRERQSVGIEKYGVTVRQDKDLTFKEWLTHLQEELLDATIYAEKIKSEFLKYRVYPDSKRLGLADTNTAYASFRKEEHAHKFGQMMWGEFYEIRLNN